MTVRTLPRDPPGEGGGNNKNKNNFKHFQENAEGLVGLNQTSYGKAGEVESGKPDGVFLTTRALLQK